MSAKTSPASEASERGRTPTPARRKTAPTASRIRPGQERARAAAARRAPARRVSSVVPVVFGGAVAGRRRRKRKRDFRLPGGASRSGCSVVMSRAGRQKGREGGAGQFRFDRGFVSGMRRCSRPCGGFGGGAVGRDRPRRRGISDDPPPPVDETVSRVVGPACPAEGGDGVSPGVGRSRRAPWAEAAGRAGVPGPCREEKSGRFRLAVERPERNRPNPQPRPETPAGQRSARDRCPECRRC